MAKPFVMAQRGPIYREQSPIGFHIATYRTYGLRVEFHANFVRMTTDGNGMMVDESTLEGAQTLMDNVRRVLELEAEMTRDEAVKRVFGQYDYREKDE